MPLPLLAVVRLCSDEYRDDGADPGMLGTVVEVFDDAYEVEFSRPDGTTAALLTLRDADLEPFTAEAAPGRAAG